MSSNLVVRFTISAAGADIPFASPFPIPSLLLENAPAQFDLQIAAAATATIWAGAPLPDTLDFFVITADQNLDVEFRASSGAILFTLPLRSGGFPLVVPGARTLTGGIGGATHNFESIRAKNRNTTTVANVTVLIAKASA